MTLIDEFVENILVLCDEELDERCAKSRQKVEEIGEPKLHNYTQKDSMTEKMFKEVEENA